MDRSYVERYITASFLQLMETFLVNLLKMKSLVSSM